MSRSRREVALALVTMLVLLVGLTGCASITTTDTTGVGAAAGVGARAEHDVAILSVDFDPPLATVGPGTPQPSLLVAIDNRGAQTEAGLVVEARLSADSSGEAIARLAQPVESLSPGQVKVVRFAAPAGVPFRSSYWLTVRVVPVREGVAFANNTKTLRIDVLAARGS